MQHSLLCSKPINSSEKMMNTILIVLFCGLIASTSHASNLQDFCVADLKRADSPSGYHCLPSDTVTSQNFKHELGPGILVPSKSKLYSSSVNEFPVLDNLGIALGRVEIERDGFLPVHTHAANEILIVVQGFIDVGLLTPGRAYNNTLKPGDLTVFPKGLLHYLVNSGKEKAVAYAFYSSPNPRLNFLHRELFGNDIPTKTIAETTFLDKLQVRKLKARFNGSG